MEELAKEVSPFRRFSRDEWAALRADTPMTLTQTDLDELRGLNDRIDLPKSRPSICRCRVCSISMSPPRKDCSAPPIISCI